MSSSILQVRNYGHRAVSISPASHSWTVAGLGLESRSMTPDHPAPVYSSAMYWQILGESFRVPEHLRLLQQAVTWWQVSLSYAA